MDMISILLIITVLVVVLFDFTNGFHDAADMVATAIASRAMTPMVAILLVTGFTFIAPFIAGLAVADTIGNFVDIRGATVVYAQGIVISGLIAAISYNLITWTYDLPSSSSYSLVGGLVGAALYGLGNESVNWGVAALLHGHVEGVMKIIVGLFLSPLMGFVVGFFLIKMLMKLLSRLTIQSRKFIIVSQYLSISWLGFSHGANDAQKGMAIIGMILFASGKTQHFTVPDWVIVLCATSITLGTMFGGWRIIRTLGFDIMKVKLIDSFADQMGAALINTLSTMIGAPTSTTQVVTTTLLGIGAAEKPRHVKWKVAFHIIGGWLVNIPVSMALGALYYMIFQLLVKGF